ncbi:CvpA family protein [Swaminathania salitolerans]|uniref:Colicin V production protein n=1 Tax=Swaminathania salitolerans TaxID=182838 RepID=A0A511BNT1_9PROT|nr:CvpA family protein [Swaminathania salitolerans]GBQ14869.1 bacteriocin/colicin V production protein [Swaminathania salitolerans LMG 21291]GEL01915.1 hypothetical protein SSA02_10780 [Swaminathania salitolerans]
MSENVDIVALVVLGASALWGGARGFAREIFSLISWVGAFLLAARVAPLMTPWFEAHLHESHAGTALSYVVAFIVLLLVLSSIGLRFAAALRGILDGGIDRLLGLVFGLARGYILLVVLFLALVSTMGHMIAREAIAGSRVAPYIESGVQLLQEFAPRLSQLRLALPPATGHDAAF